MSTSHQRKTILPDDEFDACPGIVVRVEDRFTPEEPPPGPRACRVCGERLWNRRLPRKPVCTRHADEMPYVCEAILPELARQEDEDGLVAREGPEAVRADMVSAAELLVHVRDLDARELSATVPVLAEEADLSEALVDRYVRGLARLGLVTLYAGVVSTRFRRVRRLNDGARESA